MKQLLRIIFTILIEDATMKKMISALTNETKKEHEVTKVKLFNKESNDGLRDSLIVLLFNIHALLIIYVLICIFKIYNIVQTFYTPFRNLLRYFVFWFFRIILRTNILEIPARIQVSEMECVYITQKQEEIENNLSPNNEDDV